MGRAAKPAGFGHAPRVRIRRVVRRSVRQALVVIETADAAVAEARAEEAEAVSELHRLNAHYIRAFVESDVAWYDEHLSADFTCSLADGGRRIGKRSSWCGSRTAPASRR